MPSLDWLNNNVVLLNFKIMLSTASGFLDIARRQTGNKEKDVS